MENIVSVASENFIKAVYKFENREGWNTKPGSIAKELGITNAAATDMARKLALKRLIDYQKYKELKLTPAGKKVALNVVRKHRLWETFLHQVFGLSMHEIHQEAELLEHLTSDFLTEKISLFLGNPATDPHGDPIPDEMGIIRINDNGVNLSQAVPGKEYEICRLSGSDKEFFDFCRSNHLTIGSVLKVKKQYHKNKMTEIEVNSVRLVLHRDLAIFIYVNEFVSN